MHIWPGSPFPLGATFDGGGTNFSIFSEDVRGSYAGLAHPAMIAHFRKLGVTAVELMPVHQFVHDSTLADKGLRNYWGYNTIGFFAPHNGYASFGTRGQPRRPGVLQRQAQRRQRRGQQRRREPQPLLEPRGRGTDRRPGRAHAARTPEAQHPPPCC